MFDSESTAALVDNEAAGSAARRPWEMVLAFMVNSGTVPGTTYRTRDLYRAAGIEKPTPRTPFATAQRAQLAFLDAMAHARAALLENHRVDLVTRPGTGYEVIPPGDQVRTAMRDGRKDLRAAIEKAARRVDHVKIEALDDRQRAERADAQAKIAMMRDMEKTASKRTKF